MRSVPTVKSVRSVPIVKSARSVLTVRSALSVPIVKSSARIVLRVRSARAPVLRVHPSNKPKVAAGGAAGDVSVREMERDAVTTTDTSVANSRVTSAGRMLSARRQVAQPRMLVRSRLFKSQLCSRVNVSTVETIEEARQPTAPPAPPPYEREIEPVARSYAEPASISSEEPLEDAEPEIETRVSAAPAAEEPRRDAEVVMPAAPAQPAPSQAWSPMPEPEPYEAPPAPRVPRPEQAEVKLEVLAQAAVPAAPATPPPPRSYALPSDLVQVETRAGKVPPAEIAAGSPDDPFPKRQRRQQSQSLTEAAPSEPLVQVETRNGVPQQQSGS